MSCATGRDGVVYSGALAYETDEITIDDVPDTDTAVMLNVADPASATRWWRLPTDGVGLTRIELVISNHVGIHPLALLHLDELADRDAARRIRDLTAAVEAPADFFVDQLSWGVARIAAAHHPNPVVVRFSDLKTNEYAGLLGGAQFEQPEANPMLGWRGASRYRDGAYVEAFALECDAMRRVRDDMGLTNVVAMVPFCRTLREADEVLAVLADHGLVRGRNGLAVDVMAEVPANIVLADELGDRFDGFSIGSNDLTQLVLGVDRDSAHLADIFDERDPAVMRLIAQLIETAHAKDRPVGFCGDAPSSDPAFTEKLVGLGIDSISVTPDSFVRAKGHIAAAERRRRSRS